MKSELTQTGSVAATAQAFATYSLVPYLGILFCPGAVLVGGFRILRSRGISGNTRKLCTTSVLVGIVLFVVQLLLWWILYQVPRWTRGLDF